MVREKISEQRELCCDVFEEKKSINRDSPQTSSSSHPFNQLLFGLAFIEELIMGENVERKRHVRNIRTQNYNRTVFFRVLLLLLNHRHYIAVAACYELYFYKHARGDKLKIINKAFNYLKMLKK